MITFKQLLESLSGTLTIAPRKKAEKAPSKSFREMDREHPRYNTNIRGSSMVNTRVQHDIVDHHSVTSAPIYGLKEHHNGMNFSFSSHFMDRVNNIGELRNRHISGNDIKKVKKAVQQHIEAGNVPHSKGGHIRRLFIMKNGYKFPVRIEHDEHGNPRAHFKTLLAPHMKIDSYTEPRVNMSESDEYWQNVYLEF